jgi:transcriptional regulator
MELTKQQMEIIEGSLLGDGCIWTNFITPNCKFQKMQSQADNEGKDKFQYMNWHVKTMGDFACNIKPSEVIVDGKCYKRYTFTTHMHSMWNNIEKRWYRTNLLEQRIKRIKIVPKDLVLTPLSVCVWHMDDGSSYAKDANITLETQGFTEEETLFLIEKLKDLNIHSTLKWATRKDTLRKPRIYIGRKSYFDFIDMIKPYVEWDCFQYKLDTTTYSKKPHRGETHSRAKLTEKQVIEIIEMANRGVSRKETAKKMGVSPVNISMIVSGRHWGHIKMKRPQVKRINKLTAGQVNQVITLRKEGKLQSEIATILQIDQSTISRVLKRQNGGVPSPA